MPRGSEWKLSKHHTQYSWLDSNNNKNTAQVLTELPIKDRSFIKLSCMGQIHSCFIDTGASHSILSEHLYRNLPNPPPLEPSSLKSFTVANNGFRGCLGQIQLPVLMGSQYVRITFHVVEQLLHDMIIGRDCLVNHKARIDYNKDIIQMNVSEGLFCMETVTFHPIHRVMCR